MTNRNSAQSPAAAPLAGQSPARGRGNSKCAGPPSRPVSTTSLPEGSAPLDGQILLPSPHSAPDPAPTNNQDLILRMWNTLSWNRAGQVSLIVMVVGLTATSVFLGLGQLAHALIGASTAWSAISGIAAGSGTGVATYSFARRRRLQQSNRDVNQPGP
jgi:hypothetical protein